MKKITALVLALLMVFSLVACGGQSAESPSPSASASGSPSAPAPAKTDPVRIGLLLPVSGSLAMLGDESYRGAKLALEKLNNEGGILGRPVEFVFADVPDPDAARSEAERLITKEKITVIMGTYGSGLCIAASEVAERYGVPYLECGGIADAIVERGYKYIFRYVPSARDDGRQTTRFIATAVAERLGMKPSDISIAIVYEDGTYGTSVGDGAEAEAKAQGMPIVLKEAYPSKSTDLSALALKIKEANPVALSLTSYINDATLLWQSLKNIGFEPTIMIGHGGGHAMTDLRDAVGGCATLFNADPAGFTANPAGSPGIEELIAAYEAEYNQFPRSCHSALHYGGLLMLAKFIEKAGSEDSEAIAKAARELEIPEGSDVNGWGWKVDERGQNITAYFSIMQWGEDGVLRCVFPEKMATTDFVVPFKYQ